MLGHKVIIVVIICHMSSYVIALVEVLPLWASQMESASTGTETCPGMLSPVCPALIVVHQNVFLI